MTSSLRRLAKDHAALRKSLPPNYLFEDVEGGLAPSDELTQLVILVTGAEGTPYSQGLWRLKLSIPSDYPKNPPKAMFKTRIFHPNVEEETGAVCLETLKRDWDPKLTLKDILITISCLLIQPNPDSALNAKAGALIQDDYQAFAKQAKLMTSIHAPIPKHLKTPVFQAKRRGEDAIQTPDQSVHAARLQTSDQGCDRGEDDTKENDTPNEVISSAVNSVAGKQELSRKRPLAEIPKGLEEDVHAVEEHEKASKLGHSLSQAVNAHDERPRKSPKHVHEDVFAAQEVVSDPRLDSGEVKDEIQVSNSFDSWKTSTQPSSKCANLKRGRVGGKARVGIRRL